MAELKRLVGNDGRLVQASIGGVASATVTAGQWSQVAAKNAVFTSVASVATAPTLPVSVSVNAPITITFGANTHAAIPVGGSISWANGAYKAVVTTAAVANATSLIVKLHDQSLAALLATGATTLVVGTIFQITPSIFGELAVGDFFYNPKTSNITGSGLDTAYAVSFTTMADLTSWSLDISADEVNTTVLADTVKKYRKGKQDASGQLEFMFIKGVTDLVGGMSNYFFDLKEIAATGTVAVGARKTTPLFVIGYLDEDSTSAGYTLAILMQIELFSFSLPMQDSTAVKATPKFRLTGSLNPAIYKITNP